MKILSKAAYANLLPSELFDSEASIEVCKSLFSRYVEVVEIENHNYCNRTCWFCPNAFLDRRNKINVLPSAIFSMIINDLATIDFSQTLVWSTYHEPLAHHSIFRRVSQARHILEKASLVMFSNGDYLNRETLLRLEDTGLDRLIIDIYLPEGQESDESKLENALENFSRKTGLNIEALGDRNYALCNSSIGITMLAPSFTDNNISSRAGLINISGLSEYRRGALCLEPVRHVVIDYSGKCMLCCQTRSDSPIHRSAIIGELHQHSYTLFHYYRDLAPYRRSLLVPGEKNGVCLKCNVSDEVSDKLSRREWISHSLNLVPGMKKLFDITMKKRNSVRIYERRI